MTEKKVLVFGGTIEGRQVSDFLKSREICHTLCVATEYGEEVLTPAPYLEIRQGRMNVEQMCALMRQEKFCAAVDATHPYAVEVSANIKEACKAEHLTYLRYLRPGLTQEGPVSKDDAAVREAEPVQKRKDGRIYVNSALEAARYLETQQGQIFLTTGSKELHVFAEEISDKSRLFARVLPVAGVMDTCRALGLEGRQICGMQGPFSTDINEAMLRQTKARFLVTKDTGISGGFPEKEEAAGRLGVQLVIIRRPQEDGYSWEEIQSSLEQITGAGTKKCAEAEKTERTEKIADAEKKAEARRISCIGIGMGTPDTLTHEAAKLIREADILFGAGRILESAGQMPGMSAKEAVPEYIGSKIAAYLKEHPSYRRIVILMSGDVGFYSGARGIQEAFAGENVYFCCGISSVVYFASRIPTPWQDAKLVSAHGKAFSALNYVRRYPKLILLVSGPEDVERICGELWEAGQNQVRVTVGSNLSYPEEQIRRGEPAEFVPCSTKGLHIMMLENPQACHILTPGIPDEQFIRGKVPMTKEEIRALSVAKLRLTGDAVVYDVGAGTGSVSVEIARLCTDGFVYAIERNPEGISLIRENSRRMCLSNLVTVEGTAPEALKELPVPTHAFIGGSSGNMRQIIETLLGKNPQIRIVLNTIALESISEVMTILEKLNIRDADIVQVNTAKAKTLGRYHMMTAQNPVYIIAFGGNTSVNFCQDMI